MRLQGANLKTVIYNVLGLECHHWRLRIPQSRLIVSIPYSLWHVVESCRCSTLVFISVHTSPERICSLAGNSLPRWSWHARSITGQNPPPPLSHPQNHTNTFSISPTTSASPSLNVSVSSAISQQIQTQETWQRWPAPFLTAQKLNKAQK